MSTAVETAPPQAPQPGQLTKDAYKGKIHPDWCPGCGDFSVLSALQAALFELGLKPHQVVVISGIGCSSNLPGFMHTMRRNVDLTYIVMDNQIYGLTTGQTSPTSVKGMKTKSTPHGSVENPINPIPLAMVGGATYVARGFSAKQKHLIEMMKGAIMHKGFSLVDVFSPCVTYNKDNTYQWFTPRCKILEEQGHDPSDFHTALTKGYLWGDEIPIGLFWKRTDLPALEDLEPVLHDGKGPLAFRKLGITNEQAQALIQELI